MRACMRLHVCNIHALVLCERVRWWGLACLRHGFCVTRACALGLILRCVDARTACIHTFARIHDVRFVCYAGACRCGIVLRWRCVDVYVCMCLHLCKHACSCLCVRAPACGMCLCLVCALTFKQLHAMGACMQSSMLAGLQV